MGKLSQKWTWMPLQVHYCCRRSHPNELLYIIVNRLFFITNSSQINMVSISDGRAASVVHYCCRRSHPNELLYMAQEAVLFEEYHLVVPSHFLWQFLLKISSHPF
ncbi:hypothetical protein V6Z11_D11G088100 [Gossypium hirsutum]